MRYLMQVTPDPKKFNEALKEGTANQTMGRILETIRPEAVYFAEVGGNRTCLCVVDIPDASRIPTYAEPFFLAFDSKVEFHVCISPEELRKAGLEDLGKKWR